MHNFISFPAEKRHVFSGNPLSVVSATADCRMRRKSRWHGSPLVPAGKVCEAVVGVEKALYAPALCAYHPEGFTELPAAVFLRVPLHVESQRRDGRHGIAHLVGHYTEYAVVIYLACLDFAEVGVIHLHYAVHCAGHAAERGVGVAEVELQGGVVHLQRAHESGHHVNEFPNEPCQRASTYGSRHGG